MIREHLLNWRKKLKISNYKEYLDEIVKLPKEDQETASALWTVRDTHGIVPILMAFHHLDVARSHLELK